ncbi:hypothetical protein SAMN05421841_2536 [Chryseobacterium wanjuense]|jgi:hypothetical protein|uniref:Lipoprotein n=1 Tax=Chryseobacterium wanjuense TaxID=356305 RepID=A0A1I0RDS2_9FLAO|nr:hypothetical protein [Chryseobacterium wanjuense]SEW39004.1 hypothetical protein SAMN05421841_2536 [Chryseobacterium wanjuense]
MKKFLPILLLAFVSLFIFSCDDNDNVVGDGDTYSQMRDVTGNFTNANSYAFTQGINIESTDVVLVYRYLGDSWQLIPKMMYLSGNREFQYNFVFDSQNVQIRIDDENFDLTTLSASEANQYLNNQKFRIVLVPASANKNASVNYEDYNSVIKYYNLDDSKVINIKATK